MLTLLPVLLTMVAVTSSMPNNLEENTESLTTTFLGTVEHEKLEEMKTEETTIDSQADKSVCVGETSTECHTNVDQPSTDVVMDYPMEESTFISDEEKEAKAKALEELYREDPKENLIDDTLDSDDIVDVVHNFIAERDPLLQLFLSLCFLHPTCYQLESPLLTRSQGPPSPQIMRLETMLRGRLRETARNALVDMVKVVERENKKAMFEAIREGVAERGVSVPATKNIIDAIKGVWQGVNGDLEYARANIHEIFYVLPLDTEAQVGSVLDVARALEKIPDHTKELYKEATMDGYHNYVSTQSWNSWKQGR